jgi:hypothetical protein
MSDQVLPLLQTTWGQDGDYAKFVTDLGAGTGLDWTNNNIGCQCLALAQILFYHRLQPHHSESGFYTCKKKGQPDRIVNLTFGENYFFPLFPLNFNDPGVTDHQKLLVQSYLFDVAKAFRKNFYAGYLFGPRDRVELLMSNFDVEAKFYYYEIGGSISINDDTRAHEDLDGDSVRTIEDAKLLIKRELSENRPLYMYATRALVGSKVESRHWSEGWTIANFYSIKGATYLFLLKKSRLDPNGNNVTIHEMNGDGTMGAKIESHHWSKGWTIANFYTLGETTYLFLLKRTGVDPNGKNVTIHKMNDDGTVGAKVESHHWSNGWTIANFYTLGETTYLFLLKKTGVDPNGNNVTIHKINDDGTVGAKVESHHWSEGWTAANFYNIGGSTYLFLLKEIGVDPNGKNVTIHKINDDGTVGAKVESHLWSEGYTTLKFYTHRGTTYLFMLKETELSPEGKNVYIYVMNSDGTVGKKREYRRWSEGWTMANFYYNGANTYLFLLKETGTATDGNNVHIYKIKSGGAHAVVVDGFKEEDGRFWICCKWGDPSPNNSDPNNPSDPPWFELEKSIGKINTNPLDGVERRFISIQPIRQLT